MLGRLHPGLAIPQRRARKQDGANVDSYVKPYFASTEMPSSHLTNPRHGFPCCVCNYRHATSTSNSVQNWTVLEATPCDPFIRALVATDRNCCHLRFIQHRSSCPCCNHLTAANRRLSRVGPSLSERSAKERLPAAAHVARPIPIEGLDDFMATS